MQNNTLMRLSVFLAGLIFLFSACKPNEKPWTHTDAWINPQYKDTKDFHGTAVKSRGTVLLCKVCHGLDMKGVNDVPGCYGCHFGPAGGRTPAGSTWEHGVSQHDKQSPEEAACNNCHELYRSYGLKPGACHDCHVISPGAHSSGRPWLDKKSSEFHGKSTLVCSSCHDLKSKCSTCHFDAAGSKSPAGSNWTHGSTPHKELAGSEAVCNTCHDLNRSYGNGPTACHDCHGKPPGHVTGEPWLNPKSAQFHGTSTLVCSSCHNTATECASCHFGAEGSKRPTGSTWNHGTVPHDQLSASAAVCNQCHTLERGYGNGPASCHDCHSHVRGQPWLDPKSAQFHGTSTLVCSSCHNTATECSSCHFGTTGSKIPAGSAWTHGSSTPHNQLSASAAVCNQCHKLERSYGNGPTACHDCHGTQTHVLGDPWLNPNSTQFHGKSILNCSTCHNLATECSACHFGATGSKSPTGSEWTHGIISHGQQLSYSTICVRCHELERSYANGPAICHDCHRSGSGGSGGGGGINAGHVLGEPWLNPKSAQFHGTSTLSCNMCHYLNSKCVTCHFDAAGSKSPAGSNWTHGSTPHKELAGSEAVCNTCHDLNRSYGNGPTACHDCHGKPPGHVTGEPWLNPKSAQFHGTSTLVCSSCHNTATECSSCHFGTTGSKIPAGSAWTHGSSTPHNQLSASAAVCNQCHTLERSYGNGPASCHDCHGIAAPHAVPFTAHGNSAKTDLIYCQQCHAQPAGGGPGSNPRFNVAIGSLSSGCESSGCHKAGTAHPVSWTGPASTSHQSAQKMAAACALCHGADLSGGSGPACSSCHTAGSPLTKNNCTSCHAKPPSGTAYPDVGGAHAVHNALAGVTDSCTACHAGAGSQTALHYNNVVNVVFTGYNAQSGTAAYAAADQTCSNVSCHDGNKTPAWGSGSINVATECTACHASSGQYNSYTSGEHSKHVQDLKAACSECHDTNKLAAVHFNDLSSTAMTGAGQTIRADLNYNGSSCSFTCHLDNKRHTTGMSW